MTRTDSNLDALQDIRKMMERSSRFISLSGWSGISAGFCALVGAWLFALKGSMRIMRDYSGITGSCPTCLRTELVTIAVIVFVAAFATATIFLLWIKSKKRWSGYLGNSGQQGYYGTHYCQ